MDFTLDEQQQELSALARDTFTRLATPERIAAIAGTPDRMDRDLWAELGRSGLTGVAVPEQYGGLGFGLVELALVLEAAGRTVAPVPLLDTTVAGWLVAAHGTAEQQGRWLPRIASGTAVLAVAAPQSALGLGVTGDGVASGEVVGVAWGHVADALLVPVGDRTYLLDPADPAVTTAAGITTGGQVALDLQVDGAAAAAVGGAGAATALRAAWLTALAAVQAGGCDGALRLTASYTSQRHQFGKPLSSFQGVALKAADAYVDTAAIRATALQAAWAIDQGRPARVPALTAGWWAAEAGQHCVHVTQHLHGGMGADVTYPVHRFFLQGKQIELLIGGASAVLAELADALRRAPDAGDNLVLA